MSYSRKDDSKAEIIINALQKYNVVTWVDKQDVPKGEEITPSLFQGIDESTVFVFLISPDSVESDWCKQEIEYAKKNKKIVPVYIAETQQDRIPESIKSRNYVFCRDNLDNFEQSIHEIYDAIRFDYEWANYHTHLRNKMLAWQRNNQRESWLLHGEEIKDAENRVFKAKQKKLDPPFTKQLDLFIESSKKAEKKRKKIKVTSIVVATLMIAILSIIALVIKQSENEQNSIAESRRLASESLDKKNDDKGLSLVLAYEAYKRSPTFEARRAVIQSLLATDPKTHVILRNKGRAATFAPDSNLITIGGSDGYVYFFDPDNFEYVDKPINTKMSSIRQIRYSGDNEVLAALDTDGKITLWNARSKKLIDTLFPTNTKKILAFAFIPEHNWLIFVKGETEHYNDRTLVIWDIKNRGIIFETDEIVCYGCDSVAATISDKDKIIIAYAKQAFVFDILSNTIKEYDPNQGRGYQNNTSISINGNIHVYTENNEISGFRSGTDGMAKIFIVDKIKNKTSEFLSWASVINDVQISQNENSIVVGGGYNDQYRDVTVISNIKGESNVYTLIGNTSDVVDVDINHDGSFVIASDLDGNIAIWDMKKPAHHSWFEIRLEIKHTDLGFLEIYDDYETVFFSQDGKYIVAIDRLDKVYAWDISTGNRVQPSDRMIRESLEENYGEAISPDGDLQAVAGETTKLVDPATFQEFIVLSSPSRHVKFSPDGKILVTYNSPSSRYSIHSFPMAWNLDVTHWVRKVCQIVKGNLSVEEWKEYIGEEKYQQTCPP